MKKINNSQRVVSLIISILVLLSSISPCLTVTAYETDNNASGASGITANFSANFQSGATYTGGKYVWDADSSAKDHRFIYRLTYSFSGTGYLNPGEVVFTVPKHILRNRKGVYDDYYDIAAPHKSQVTSDSEFYYEQYGDSVRITSNIRLSAGQSGYIDIGYDMGSDTFQYEDMCGSDTFHAQMSVNGSTRSASAPPCYVNTGAKIKSVQKYGCIMCRRWDEDWGAKPADADDYYYLVWAVATQFDDVTQPYTFTLRENFNHKDAEVIGYKFNDQEQFTANNFTSLSSKINGQSVWLTQSQIGNIGDATAIAVDLRYSSSGGNFVLEPNKSVTVSVYMKAPGSEPSGSGNSPAKAYNNVYISHNLINYGGTNIHYLIHQDYTEISLRVMADVKLHKFDTKDPDKPVKGISFCLEGTSDYGTGVYKILTTDRYGNLTFKNVEKGEYTLYEYEGMDDYQLLTDKMHVVVSGSGSVTIDGKSSDSSGYFLVGNKPRIHTDVQFTKKDIVYKDEYILGATFKLSGTSDYGNKIVMYAKAEDYGIVTFKNVELGTYTMVETETDENHILSNIKYTVRVDENSNFSISDSERGLNGALTIYNEPYHHFYIQKVSATTGYPVRGATFTLKGTSDYGTFVNLEKTSPTDGIIMFDKLEPGNYVLQETAVDGDYVLDDTKRVVTITPDDVVTIDGLSKNDMGYFEVENKLGGDIVITKKWVDNIADSARPTPVIHVSSEIPNREVYFNGSPSASYLSNIANISLIKGFAKWTGDESVALNKIASLDAVKIDDNSTPYSIYAWLSNGTVYWWSDCANVYMTNQAKYLFYNLTACTSIDLSGINTSKMTDMSYMFSGDTKLTSITFGSFNTANVTDMSHMFQDCSSLSSLNVSGFNTANVTNMAYMFYNCKAIQTLAAYNFNTAKVTNMAYMFYNCQKLGSLPFTTAFNTANVTDMQHMFDYCQAMTSVTVSNFNTAKVTNMAYMFHECRALKSLTLTNFNTANVTDMQYMFASCINLSSLDVSSFNTANVKNMKCMFGADVNNSDFGTYMNLTSIKWNTTNFNTSNCTDMAMMFNRCYKVASLDISKFNTAKVTDMQYMFSGCQALKSLTFNSTFTTANVTNMQYMFTFCSSLTSLNLRYFNTAKVTNMTNMFGLCSSLTSLTISSFSTRNVTDMSYMFQGCSKLSGTFNLEKFNTAKVTDMSYMFSGCSRITALTINNFNTSNVMYMDSMFDGCSALVTIYASTLFTVTQVSSYNSYDMFYGCTKIKGGNGTTYSSSRTDKTYAKIDKAGQKGYFTSKAISSTNATIYASGAVVNNEYYDSLTDEQNDLIDTPDTPDAPDAEPESEEEPNEPDYEQRRKMFEEQSAKSMPPAAQDKPTEEELMADFVPAPEAEIKLDEISENAIVLHRGAKKTVLRASGDTSTKTVHYISNDNNIQCTVTHVDKNTWEFKFEGLYSKDIDTYYVWEEYLQGYISSNSIDNPATLVDGKATITNTAVGETPDPDPDPDPDPEPEKPKTGSIKVSKKLTGENLKEEDKQRSFLFTVELKNADGEALTGNAVYGDTAFKDGVAVFRLADGESVTFSEIPENYTYKITEQTEEGFESTSEKAEGTIVKNTTVESKFTNQKTYTDDDNTSFRLEKKVSGNFEINTEEYLFYIAFDGLRSRETYTISTVSKETNGNDKETEVFTKKKTFTANAYGEAAVSLTLANGEMIEVQGIPIGSHYQVTEQSGKYISSYTVTDAEGIGLIKRESDANTAEEKALSTETETADAEEKITITYFNRKFKTQDVVLKKVLANSSRSNTEKFDFKVTLSNLSSFETIMTSTLGKLTADSLGNLTVKFKLAADDEISFLKLPIGTIYQITEAPSDYKASYEIVDNNTEQTLKKEIKMSTAGNTETNTELTTAEEVVNEGEEAVITYTNTKSLRDVTVAKYVDISAGDVDEIDYQHQKFTFNVALTGLIENTTYLIDVYSAKNTSPTQLTYTTDGVGTANISVDLCHEQYFKLRNLPTRAKYRITEQASNHYKAAFTVSGNSGAIIESTGAENETYARELSTLLETVDEKDLDVQFTFTNTYVESLYVLPAAGMTNKIPVIYSLMTVASVFGVIYVTTNIIFIAKKRRRNSAV